VCVCGCSVFLREEREKLAAYRDSTRAAVAEAGKGAELAAELPAPLAVGQRVSAKHPKTRQVAEGAILTVDNKGRSRVQFDRRELGSEIVEVRQHRPQEGKGGQGIGVNGWRQADPIEAIHLNIRLICSILV
jgi:hypothetical protein